MTRIGRKTIIAAGVLAAAALTAVPAAQASARTAPSVTSSYSCHKVKIGGHRYEDCALKVAFTGPMGAWKVYFQTPRREKLANFSWQVDDSSEMGSSAPVTKYAPLVINGSPDDWASYQIPAGVTCTGGFYFDVPLGQPVPRVWIKVSR